MKIGISHVNASPNGGSEQVCFNMIKALQDSGHDVELITNEQFSKEEVSQFYGIELEKLDIVEPFFAKYLPGSFAKIKSSLLSRYLRKNSEDYDILISTKNEANLGDKGIQYVHFPEIAHRSYAESRSLPYSLYLYVYLRFFKPRKEKVEQNKTICNSEWTSDIMKAYYDVEPKIIFPPTRKISSSKDWRDRENGFVSIGRIGEDKRQLKQIEIIDGLREKGEDVHLHICGKGSGEYYQKVKEEAIKRDYIRLEGFVGEEKYIELLKSHKYGLHTKRNEHYGITVAEMVQADMKPFAYDLGGPRNIIGSENLLFNDRNAVETIYQEIRNGAPELNNNYINTSEQFQDKLVEYIGEKNS